MKGTKLYFLQHNKRRITRPLELVPSDVCGPLPITLAEGSGIVVVTDDHTMYSVIYLLNEKSQVFDRIREYVVKVTIRFGRKPEFLQSE